jgi:hypothetical protein
MTKHNAYPKYRGRRAVAAASLALLAAACGTGSNSEAAPTSAPVSASATPEAAPTPVATTESAPTTTAAAAGSTAVSRKVIVTFYGAADNDPAGSTVVAHPEVQPEAGGTGTYEDPLTMAVKVNNNTFGPFGGIFYVPGLKKYFIFADECGSPDNPDECTTDVDLYVGNPSKTKAVLACEDELTPDRMQIIIQDPPKGLPVAEAPLWDGRTDKCGRADWELAG